MFWIIATTNKMAKIVLAGRSDCPYFAKCELLGDCLERNLKKFKLHKIIIQPEQWENWLNTTCTERGWSFKKSPIVWRELIDRGGKGVLIGDANDFQEYAKAYYDVEYEINSFDMLTICSENKIEKDRDDQEERDFKALSQPVNVCITNAASPICYYLINSLSSGKILGPGIELTIRLLVSSIADIEQVTGTAMEAEDLASGLLRDVKVCISPHEAFENCSFIIMLDNLIKSYTESQKDWLDRNEEYFSRLGAIINAKSLPTCKVLLCGNGPLNLNAMVVLGNAPHLSHNNIVAVSSVVENHGKSLIGEKLNVNPAGIVNLIVWGNINHKHYFDVSNCRVHGYGGAVKGPFWDSVSALEMIHDKRWAEKELPKLVVQRTQKMAEAHGYQTGMSTANSIASTLQNMCRGAPQNQIYSLGIYSEGWYSVPHGIYFSFPVTMDPKGCWHVVQDLDITEEIKDAISASVQEIKTQLLMCLRILKQPGQYDSLFGDQKTAMETKDSSATLDILDNDKASLWSHEESVISGTELFALDDKVSAENSENLQNSHLSKENIDSNKMRDEPEDNNSSEVVNDDDKVSVNTDSTQQSDLENIQHDNTLPEDDNAPLEDVTHPKDDDTE